MQTQIHLAINLKCTCSNRIAQSLSFSSSNINNLSSYFFIHVSSKTGRHTVQKNTRLDKESKLTTTTTLFITLLLPTIADQTSTSSAWPTTSWTIHPSKNHLIPSSSLFKSMRPLVNKKRSRSSSPPHSATTLHSQSVPILLHFTQALACFHQSECELNIGPRLDADTRSKSRHSTSSFGWLTQTSQ